LKRFGGSDEAARVLSRNFIQQVVQVNDPNLVSAIGKLREALAAMRKTEIWTQIVEPRDQVLARFQPVFAAPSLESLTAEAFRPFLYFENNCHWTGLHRQVNNLCADVPALRKALGTLLDESRPVGQRLTDVVGSIKGLGKGTVTAILHVTHPDKYGVWNNTSDGALAQLGIYPTFERGESFGARYAKINGILHEIAAALQVDLWTLDALWWLVVQGDELPAGAKGGGSGDSVAIAVAKLTGSQYFGLERHLHDFLFDNWDSLDLGRDWAIYAEAGDDAAGYEYSCAVGRIDILARHRQEKKWLVVELKRSDASDAVVGQTLRYIGWVQEHLAEPGDSVHGLIIAREGDAALHYAVRAVPNLTFQVYEVEFRLKTSEPRTPS
jgi:hypothetical protein